VSAFWFSLAACDVRVCPFAISRSSVAPIAASRFSHPILLPVVYPAPELLGFFLANDQAPISLFSILQKAAHQLEYTKRVLRGLPLRP
jgi:hypothetical protein